MATIEIIIRDDEGNIIKGSERRKYELDLGSSSFNEIEGAIEEFKKASLPDITRDLLEEAQSKFIKKRRE